MREEHVPPLPDIDRIGNQALWKGCGYSDDDIRRPLIGIANAFSDMVPGHTSLRTLAQHVKYGVYRAGGTPAEFGVIGCCDGLACGHNGNDYVLPSRDNIADSIEIIASAHRLDGLVLLGSCDKIVPGMLMAAARLDIPCIFLAGGSMLSGPAFEDIEKSDTTSVSEAQGMMQAGKVDELAVRHLSDVCGPTCGSCQFMGTANSMCCLAEGLGMSLPGSALIPAVFNERLRAAERTGETAVQMVRSGLTARKVITRDSIENAIMLMMATGGSTNTVIHTCALAHELGIPAGEILEAFDRYGEEIPLLAKINPATHAYDSVDLYYAGGVPEVMLQMRDHLHLSQITVTGRSLGEELRDFRNPYPPNPDLIRTMENPHSTLGGIAIMRGNLAPDTGVSKPAAVMPEVRRFTGQAICFDSEAACEEALQARRIKPGHVVVIRYEGPKGGPGMKELYKPMKLLRGQGLASSTAVITDGRFSGTNGGCFVGHISPEAAAGGPLALVEDGDSITIDIMAKTLTLHVSDAELARRRAAWVYHPKPMSGYLKRYAAMVSSADKGGILEVPDSI